MARSADCIHIDFTVLDRFEGIPFDQVPDLSVAQLAALTREKEQREDRPDYAAERLPWSGGPGA